LANLIMSNKATLTHLRLNNVVIHESIIKAIHLVSENLIHLSLDNACFFTLEAYNLFIFNPFKDLNSFKNLNSLSLNAYKCCSYPNTKPKIIPHFLLKKHNVRNLDLSNMIFQSDEEADLEKLIENLVDIEVLIAWRISINDINQTDKRNYWMQILLERITATSPNLKELDIGWSFGAYTSSWPSKTIPNLCTNCPNITRLILAKYSCLSDEDLEAISNLQLLQQLDLCGTTAGVTAVKHLAVKVKTLKLLDISWCRNFTTKHVWDLKQIVPLVHIVHNGYQDQ